MLADVAANSDIPILLANQGENRQAVADYLLAGGISPRSVVLETHMTLMDGAGNGVLPTTIFVDAKGKIVATQVGEISRAALSDKVQQLQGDCSCRDGPWSRHCCSQRRKAPRWLPPN